MPRPIRFWDRIAKRYAARIIKDPAAYEAMLADAAGRLRPTDRVLEIGCGTGSIAIRLAPRHGRRPIFRLKCCASPAPSPRRKT